MPEIEGDCVTQVSEQTEARVSTKLSQEFGRTKRQILCTLAKLGVFPPNSRVLIQDGTTSVIYRIYDRIANLKERS